MERQICDAKVNNISPSRATQNDQLTTGAWHLSEHTEVECVNTFNKCTPLPGDNLPIENITHEDIEDIFTVQTAMSNLVILMM